MEPATPRTYQRWFDGRYTVKSAVPSPVKSPKTPWLGGTTFTVTLTLAVSEPSLACTVTVYGEPDTAPAPGASCRSPATRLAKPGLDVIDVVTGSPFGSPVVRSTSLV